MSPIRNNQLPESNIALCEMLGEKLVSHELIRYAH
jgi:hypothetical protein